VPHELPRGLRVWGAGAKHEHSREHYLDVNRLHDEPPLCEAQRHERMSDSYADSRERQFAYRVRSSQPCAIICAMRRLQ
jgi:hypothetical protein